MKIINCEQGSPEWFAARAGMPTASEFHTVLAKGRSGNESLTRRTYMFKLAGEILTGEPMENYTNGHMERGKIMEHEAREVYSCLAPAALQRVGFIINGPKGCSPDSLIGNDGLVEIKTKLPHLTIDLILKNEFPPEHKAQCQGALWVTERNWIDIAVYWPRLPIFVKRAYRDELYIKNLSDAVDQFNVELSKTVEFIRSYGATSLAEQETNHANV